MKKYRVNDFSYGNLVVYERAPNGEEYEFCSINFPEDVPEDVLERFVKWLPDALEQGRFTTNVDGGDSA